MSDQEFVTASREKWQDVADHRTSAFAKVIGQPHSLASTVAHVILSQGDIEGSNIVLFHSDGLPVLFKQGAVLYPQDASV